MRILTGPTNVGVLERDGRYLLIGCWAAAALRQAGIRPERVEWILLTHHHRTASDGVPEMVALGAKLAVPDAERTLFEQASSFWASDVHRVHAYHFHPSSLTFRADLPVHRSLHEYEVMEWRGTSMLAVGAPGPTDGGMAYIVREGNQTVAFVGDLICGDGRLWDFYSLQGRRHYDHGELMEYHGFGERASDVMASLERILAHRPQRMVPSRGPIVDQPDEAVRRLGQRIERCMANYHSIGSVRWYFPAAWPTRAVDTGALKARCRSLPAWVVEISPTSRALEGHHGGVFLLDCAGDAPDGLGRLRQQGRLGHVEHIWITHYHDDHVEHVNRLRNTEHCTVIAHESMSDILRRPEAYCMPCLDPRPITPDRVTHDGETWEWGGFRLTAFTFPGQTLYDAALLVERDGARVLFVGDSLTPGGLDDYCAYNRNLLGPGRGYDRSLALLETLGADVLLVNQHVGGGFVFTAAEVRDMRQTLASRYDAFRDVMEWDDPNFGLDPRWVRVDPYRCTARGGEVVRWRVVLLNHSSGERVGKIRVHPPHGWSVPAVAVAFRARPNAETAVDVTGRAPAVSKSTRHVVGFSVVWQGRPLGELAEAIVDIQ